MPMPLGEIITPCGPVIDPAAAERVHEKLSSIAEAERWLQVLDGAWSPLAPIFSASPYLATLAIRAPNRLRRTLTTDPNDRAAAIIEAAKILGKKTDIEASAAELRRLKGDLHLVTALADLGGTWSLDQVTGVLSAFADAAVSTALELAAAEALAAGKLTRLGAGREGPIPGLFFIAMGKLGAFELNYSSDIDITAFHDPDALPLAPGVEPGAFATRITERVAGLIQSRTVEGYVFRVDLRLRPDPSSTPACVSLLAAFDYYESVGQNWERAALIKARPMAGDLARGDEFLEELSAFIWRRNLDFAAIADIHSIKRQIHTHKVDDRLTAAGADLKLGRGGIREIEFYVQTQQLILGGRHPDLRASRTLEALAALERTGQIEAAAASDMAGAYDQLRRWEHRIQMVGDEQTHRLPQADADRRRVAALSGFSDLRRFDAAVGRTLKTVNKRYGALFAGEEALSSRFGSLVFTGVEDDPETLATLARMGFSQPERISAAIRGWHHGHIAATRTERGREAFTRLAPRLLDAIAASGAPDIAFARFVDFFSGLTSGVQVQSLFLAQPRLLELVVRIMAFAPRFAATLARRPAALDALLDPGFFGPIAAPMDLPERIAGAGGFEAAMDLARRVHREDAFRIAVQVLGGVAGAEAAGPAFADLADALIAGLAQASLDEVERTAGAFPGEVAVIALGKCGSREMSATSDLDLMTLYRPTHGHGVSAIKELSAETFYTRFTQRLVAALSAPTAEGGLYEVDLQLRPSGTKGPVAVSVAAFESYYAGEAETWELLAMTRARVVWASSPAFEIMAAEAIERALRRPRHAVETTRDVAAMRALMAKERPPIGFWDMKLSEGGLVDIEFCAQLLQLLHAGGKGPLHANTGQALDALKAAALAPAVELAALKEAWTLQQDLSQLLKIALDDGADPAEEPAAFRTLLAKAGGAREFKALRARIAARRLAVRRVFDGLVGGKA